MFSFHLEARGVFAPLIFILIYIFSESCYAVEHMRDVKEGGFIFRSNIDVMV